MINYAEILSQLIDDDGFVRSEKIRDSRPAGFIESFAGDVLPIGYLPAHGGAYNRKTYSSLFKSIGTLYGDGDGKATFNVPDVRGLVIRGWDAGRGLDPDRILGSEQGDAIRNITGAYGGDSWGYIGNGSGAITTSYRNSDGGAYASRGIRHGLTFDASRVVPTAEENRMKNIAFTTCIKY